MSRLTLDMTQTADSLRVWCPCHFERQSRNLSLLPVLRRERIRQFKLTVRDVSTNTRHDTNSRLAPSLVSLSFRAAVEKSLAATGVASRTNSAIQTNSERCLD